MIRMRARGQGSWDPFQRFSEPAKKTLTLAQEEAERGHLSYVGTEHVLVALLRVQDAIAYRILTGRGVELAKVRQGTAPVRGRNERITVQLVVPTREVKKVIEIASQEARRRDQRWVCTDHLLLSLLNQREDSAARVLQEMGVTKAEVDSEMRRLRDAGVSERGLGADPPS